MIIIIYTRKSMFNDLMEEYLKSKVVKATIYKATKKEDIDNLIQKSEKNVIITEETDVLDLFVEYIDYEIDLLWVGMEYIENNSEKHIYNCSGKLEMISRYFINNVESEKSNILDNLTKREIEILQFISKGMLNKEIANELNITERTVKNHISNIFKKINVYDRTQAAVFAIKNKIFLL